MASQGDEWIIDIVVQRQGVAAAVDASPIDIKKLEKPERVRVRAKLLDDGTMQLKVPQAHSYSGRTIVLERLPHLPSAI